MARRHPSTTFAGATALAVVILVGCGSDGETGDDTPGSSTDPEPAATEPITTADAATSDTAAGAGQTDELYPDVLDATATFDGSTWTFSATLSSPYDTPERYADAWRVVGPDGTVYGERILTHDHANEQPFTRSTSGVEIPDDVESVVVEGRDQVSGWGGATVTVELER